MEYYTTFLTIASPQIEQLIQFYKALFQQKPNPYIPNKYAEFEIKGGLKLGIFKPRVDQELEFSQPQKSAMSLCVEVENLESAIAQLNALGYPPTTDIMIASHGREIYAYDPDGNRLIFHSS
ncbi:VOC family protein [Euhalothece natronophila Z-M001]|uniref:VOC family protein n=1 Tax=Euhalothece natronophila Z-M001 TaxID=522448 RepID=A0A5B8NNU0_9CHRO|nr:VOC family protein [Euhalothece natronophila]QDZ40617.1 VOC family protein [Euhalothece natronophila Z-M001]